MSTLDERLAEIRARTEGLVPGPWTWSVGGVEALDYDGEPVMIFEREDRHVTTRNDAAFVAHARTDVPALLAAVDAVLAVHGPAHATLTDISGNVMDIETCATCRCAWYPCPTVRAVTEAIGGGE